MGKIELTNIIVDDFSIAKRETNKIYTHILTHIHTDHLKGLVDGWNYGPIYCTQITKALLLQKFPSLTCITAVELQTPIVLKMSPSLELKVTFFDANHCFGAAMVLIQGYIGTILYSGDIRFDRQVFQNYNHLYPLQLRNVFFAGCSKHIDLLYLDNTFLKKKFEFPKREEVLQQAVKFIKQLIELNQHTRIYIALDNYGKQEIVEHVAKELDVYIVVSEVRYEVLQAMGRDIQLYTTNREEGFIQVISKRQLKDYLEKDKESICFIFSGWVNHSSYRLGGRIYCFPYSLHSNFQEIHEFVNSIRPSYIQPIVFNYPEQDRIFYAEKDPNKMLKLFEDQNAGNGYYEELQQLRQKYCTPPSQEYLRLRTDSQLQKMIQQMLLPPKMLEFDQDEKSMTPLHLQVVQRKKYKLKNERNETQINRLRNQIQLKRKLIEGERVEVIEEEAEQQPNQIIIEQSQDDAIPIDLQVDEFSIDYPEVVQVNPSNKTNRYSRGPQKIKKPSCFPCDQPVMPFNKAAQQRFLEKVRRKLQEQKGPKYAASLFPRKEQVASEIPEAMELKSTKRNEMVQQTVKKSPPVSWLTQINMDNVQKMRILKTDSEVLDFFKQNKEDFDFIAQQLRRKKNGNEHTL